MELWGNALSAAEISTEILEEKAKRREGLPVKVLVGAWNYIIDRFQVTASTNESPNRNIDPHHAH